MNVVFASGVLVPQHLLKFDYFRGIGEAFPGSLFPQTPVTAGIDVRASALAAQIDQAFPTGPIHVVAHSMGGLDTRCMLSNNLRGLADPGRVASLSTISTPHRGSPLADLLVGPAPDGGGIRPFAYKLLRHAFDELGLSFDALGDLTLGETAAFNAAHPDVPHIAYRSYAGAGVESIALKGAHLYLETIGQSEDARTNDGIMTKESARWGEFDESLWPTDDAKERFRSCVRLPDDRPAGLRMMVVMSATRGPQARECDSLAGAKRFRL
jgi:triacylglycerol lipase